MCKDCEAYAAATAFPVPAPRSYRTTMKRMTPRKRSSYARISVNRFWNQLEEFQQQRREEEDLVDMETLECDREVQQVFVNDSGNFSDYAASDEEEEDEDTFFSAADSSASTTSSCYCSATSSAASPVYFVSCPLPSPPPAMVAAHPPRSLPLPPSFQQTKPLLHLLENLSSWTLCTAV